MGTLKETIASGLPIIHMYLHSIKIKIDDGDSDKYNNGYMFFQVITKDFKPYTNTTEVAEGLAAVYGRAGTAVPFPMSGTGRAVGPAIYGFMLPKAVIKKDIWI